ncbi:MAG: tRNA uracil 4-sulfurtransferase ThiI, partial [bacterium]|nr:tRNA uracil 4-sulfurtransferase ThiI [bacterium]
EYDFLKRISGRFIVKLNDKSETEEIAQKLQKIFGLAYFCLAYETSQDLEKIKTDAWQLISGSLTAPAKTFKSFRIEARRAGKSFPFTSQNINEIIGEYIKNKSGAKVNLGNPDLTIFIEIAERFAFIYFEKIPGPGGLPTRVSGKIISLLSSGIDSPVASYRMMKRGCEVVFCHFHSYPMTSRASQENVLKLCGVLKNYQPSGVKIYFVPFLDIQKKILKEAPEKLRVVLYRRQMLKIAQIIAKEENALGLATGESIGQVASQTLENILVINEAVNLPVFRPLAGQDKEEIIREAKKIGAYEISIRPYEDCCSLFMPERPETKAKLDEVLKIEKKIKLNSLLSKSLKQARVVEL